MIAVGAGDGIFGGNLMQSVGGREPVAPAEELATILFMAQIYLTTLIQGVLLNCVLAAYGLIVYAICLVTMQPKLPKIYGDTEKRLVD